MRKLSSICAFVAAAVIFVSPQPASAKISNDLEKELQGYLDGLAEEKHPRVKQSRALTLGWLLNRKKAVKALEPMKTSDVYRVRLGAGMGLLLAGDRKADEFLIGEFQKKSASLYPTLREVVSVLPDEKEADLLEKLAKESKPPLRRDVMRYLVAQTGSLFEVVEGAAVGKDADMRKAAVTALTAHPSSRGLKVAEKLLAKKDADSRLAAVSIAEAASRRSSLLADATNLLEKAVGDDDPRVTEKAARRLVELNNDRGVSPLIALTAAKPDDEAAGRKDIYRFLLEHDARPKAGAVRPLVEKASDDEEKKLVYQLLASSGDPEVYQELVEMYGSTEFDTRLLAAQAIGFTGNPKAAAVLTRSLFEGRTEIRLASAKGLAELGEPGALASLRKAVNLEKDPQVKLAAIEAIGNIRKPDALQTLRFLVTDRDPEVKKATLAAIRKIGLKQGANALDVLLRDRNVDVQWLAFITAMDLDPEKGKRSMAVALRNPPESFIEDVMTLEPAVQKRVFDYLFEQDSSLRENVVRHAIEFGGYGDELRQLLVDSSVSEALRAEILLHLADQKGPKNKAVLEGLVRKAGSERISHLAAWMLTRWSTPDLEPSFRGYLGMKDPVVRAAAVYGLATIHATK